MIAKLSICDFRLAHTKAAITGQSEQLNVLHAKPPSQFRLFLRTLPLDEGVKRNKSAAFLKRFASHAMEFLLGRSLANNITNLLLRPFVAQIAKETRVDLFSLLEKEPDAGLGNGGLGRLAACFLDSMATMELPAMGYGLRYEYGIFKQVIHDGWQQEQPDNWLRRPDPWEVARPPPREGGDQAQLLIRVASWSFARSAAYSFDPVRHPLRSLLSVTRDPR